MTSGKFLFVTWDGGGNTPPAYLLAQRLVGRGHRVTVLGDESQAARVHELGGKFMPLIPPEDFNSFREGDRLRWRLLSPAVGQAVLSCIQQEAPDALVIDTMMAAGLAAAEYVQLPSAALVHVLYHTFALRGVRGPRSFRALFENAFPIINAMRAGFGLAPVESTTALLHPMKVALVTSPQEFDLPMPDLPGNVRYTGAIREDVPFSGQHALWAWGDARPRIVVSFSTTNQNQTETLRRVAAALATLPVQAVMTTGGETNQNAIAPSPNVALHRFIPHGMLLPGCALVVTHAGLGTAMAALAHGVPLLCMPMGADQYDNAARVTACGAGIVLAQDTGVEEIGHALQELLADPGYGAAARRLAATMACQDGPATAINELEALLA